MVGDSGGCVGFGDRRQHRFEGPGYIGRSTLVAHTYQAFRYLIPQSPIPWLHIAGAVAAEAHSSGYVRLGILGTKYLAESGVYPEALAEFKIESEIPDEADRKKINEIIFKELVNGVFPETSRLYFNEVAGKLKARHAEACEISGSIIFNVMLLLGSVET